MTRRRATRVGLAAVVAALVALSLTFAQRIVTAESGRGASSLATALQSSDGDPTTQVVTTLRARERGGRIPVPLSRTVFAYGALILWALAGAFAFGRALRRLWAGGKVLWWSLSALAVVALAVGLRLVLAREQPLSVDELWLLWSKGDLGAYLVGGEARLNPPFYAMLSGLLLPSAHGDPHTLRLLAVAIGGFFVALVALWGRLSFGRGPSLLMAIVAALHPFALSCGVMNRAYGLGLLGLALAFVAIDNLRERGLARDAFAAFALLGGLAWTHYMLVAPAVALGIAVFLFSRSPNTSRDAGGGRRPARRLGLSFLVMLAFLAPLLPGLVEGAGVKAAGGAAGSEGFLGSSLGALAGATAPELRLPAVVEPDWVWLASAVLLVVLAGALWLTRRDWAGALAALFGLGLFVPFLMATRFATVRPLHTFPALMAVIAALGVVGWWGLGEYGSSKPWTRRALGAIRLLVVAAAIAVYVVSAVAAVRAVPGLSAAELSHWARGLGAPLLARFDAPPVPETTAESVPEPGAWLVVDACSREGLVKVVDRRGPVVLMDSHRCAGRPGWRGLLGESGYCHVIDPAEARHAVCLLP